jgi:glutamate/tyrosine decarboxylase-like PLP-dependent enzyme
MYLPEVAPEAALATAFAAACNPQLAAWATAPGAVALEARTLGALAGAIPWDARTAGMQFTTGAAEGNLTALLLALDRGCPAWRGEGLVGLPARPRVYASQDAHPTVARAVQTAGLGAQGLRLLPTDARGRLPARALRRALVEDRAAGWLPVCVVGTLGTTVTGALDPVGALAEVLRDEGVWLHIDAAYGGGALLVPSLRGHLEGIDRCDSLAWDAHKTLPVPLGAGMFFTPSRSSLRGVFSHGAGYLPKAGAPARPEPAAEGLRWSRGPSGAATFAALASLGLRGAGERFARTVALGERLRGALRSRGWAIVNDTPLPVVCAWHPDLRGRAPRGLGRALPESLWVLAVTVRGRPALRACIASGRSTEADVDALVDALEGLRRR